MGTTISAKEKRDFIRWFLEDFDLRRRECVWILSYLASAEHLLDRVHFVEGAKYCPHGMVMTTRCSSDKETFRYYRQDISTSDAEKAFHDIRLNSETSVYIQLNFADAKSYAKYIGILEENEFSPESKQVSKEDARIAARFMDGMLLKGQVQRLKDQIDIALDTGDKEIFKKLSEELKALKYKH